MKLLFDEHLSPRLVRKLADVYPGSAHVHDLDLGRSEDRMVWEHARDHGCTIVSKDADFTHLAFSLGSPPQVIWLRLGNCTTSEHRPRLARRSPQRLQRRLLHEVVGVALADQIAGEGAQGEVAAEFAFDRRPHGEDWAGSCTCSRSRSGAGMQGCSPVLV